MTKVHGLLPPLTLDIESMGTMWKVSDQDTHLLPSNGKTGHEQWE